MTTTISNILHSQYTVTGASQASVTITNSGGVEINDAPAIYGAGQIDTTITNAGTISSSEVGQFFQDNGIELKWRSTIDNQSSGSIFGYYTGVYLIGGTYPESQPEMITNAGVIHGDRQGIRIYAPVATVINSGTITGGSGQHNTHVYTRIAEGIIIHGSGLVDNQVGGLIEGTGNIFGPTNYGVVITGYGTVHNAGRITSDGDGVSALTVNNSGVISAAYNAVDNVAGTVTNTGTITSTTRNGVYIKGAGTLTNAGTIGGAQDSVKFAGAGAGRLIVDAGAVFNGTAQGNGSTVLELTPGGAGTLAAFASGFTGFAITIIDPRANWELDGAISGGTITLSGGGDVLGIGDPAGFTDTIKGFVPGNTLDLVGLTFAAGASASLTGNVLDVVSNGVTDHLTLDLTGVPAGATFIAADDGGAHGVRITFAQPAQGTDVGGTISHGIALEDSGNPFTVDISGVVDNGSGAALYAAADAVSTLFTISTLGTVTGTTAGLSFAAAGVLNSGTIQGSSAVELGQGNVANQAGGTISGALVGVVISTNGSVNNAGLLSGDTAVYLPQAGSVTNTGTILGEAAGVRLDNGGSVDNSGRIRADSGAGILGTGATITNSGTVLGSNYGIRLSGGTVTNTGLIQGTTTAGIAGTTGTVTNSTGTIAGVVYGIAFNAGGTVTNATGAHITGATGVSISGGAATVHNAGTIAGTTQAVQFAGAFADRVILDATSRFTGTVQGGSGTNVLELTTLDTNGTLTDPGAEFLGFSTIELDDGAGWKISGTIAGDTLEFAGAGTLELDASGPFNATLLGFSADATLDLQGLAYADNASVSFADGTLTVSSGGTVDTFAMPDITNGTQFRIADNGEQGQGVLLGVGPVLNQPITTTLSAGITLENPFQNPLSIAHTGAVTLASGVAVYGYAATDWKIVNSGKLISGLGDGSDVGIYLAGTGDVTNRAGGTIAGFVGVYQQHGIVSNAGHITGSNAGIVILQAGTIDNLRGGTIAIANNYAASYGIFTGLSGPSTVTNAGLIQDGKYGVFLNDGGIVTNKAGGTISGTQTGVGMVTGGAETVVNAGTISGGTYAINFFNSGITRLVVDPGAVFVGKVSTGNNDNTLEFARGNGSTGTLSGIGTQFIRFKTFQVDEGARWQLTGANTITTGTLTNDGVLQVSNGSLSDAGGFVNDGRVTIDPATLTLASLTGSGSVVIGGAGTLVVQGTVGTGQTIDFADGTGVLDAKTTGFSGVIGSLARGDVVDITNLPYQGGATAIATGGTLTVSSGGTSVQFDTPHLSDRSYLVEPDSGTGTEFVACYCPGTHIATPHGDVRIELLAIGDLVRTQDGDDHPIRWIGRRAYSEQATTARARLRPIRVRAGALGNGLPLRDLLVSPEHALFIDGMLVPAGLLVNGTSITREPAAATAYLHLELDRHAILLAEGAPAESFIDDESRAVFENAKDFTGIAAPARFCAPRLTQGAQLAAIQARIDVGAVTAPPPGRLLGHVERIGGGVLEGWALDEATPGIPVALDVRIGTGAKLRVLANRYRHDLDRAGLAAGHCAFFLPLDEDAADITVSRAQDGVRLAEQAGGRSFVV